MQSERSDTIASISTPLGEGGIGIVRISGPEAILISRRLFRTHSGKYIRPSRVRRMIYGKIIDPQSGDIVDEVLLLIMPGPRSYTCEDVVEIDCHGGPQPLKRVLELILKEGARLAEPGEFTRRAFLNGRIDLAQAEAVIDVIRSRSDAALKRATRQLVGQLSDRIREIRNILVGLLADLEARLDFPEDVDEIDMDQWGIRCQEAMAKIGGLLNDARRGRVLREGVSIAIVGKVNVGKSSLLNALLGSERAIVTDIPGTTRDTVEDVAVIRGIPVRLIDTAGIRETKDAVESIGVTRAVAALERADLLIFVIDSSRPLDDEDLMIWEKIKERSTIIVLNKVDLGVKVTRDDMVRLAGSAPIVYTSILNHEGISELEDRIFDLVSGGGVEAGADPLVGNIRHIRVLEASKESLEAALNTLRQRLPIDMVAVDVREAVDRLGEITGEAVSEDVINRIFEEFCIGK
ncbi:MAG: tRNA uridine-5-carboxymethylaminomethyl(34) synthesis GTPase MnmE [Firmicutes bacterium]|nr:tRNA uridine-5-carboxymethylaminomethyl(34) synthesis GTPase MnmE [Bacillota bacterium]